MVNLLLANTKKKRRKLLRGAFKRCPTKKKKKKKNFGDVITVDHMCMKDWFQQLGFDGYSDIGAPKDRTADVFLVYE